MAKVIVIGAGAAGCEVAATLAALGTEVELIEQYTVIGGNLNNWYQLFPDRKPASSIVTTLEKRIEHPNIRLRLNTGPVQIQFTNSRNYTVLLDDHTELNADAVVLATGFKTFNAERKEEYGYTIYQNVITSVEMENQLLNHAFQVSVCDTPQRIGFLHCVGSRDEKVCRNHCSKVCCITAVKQAVELREQLPNAEIFCFYMDMRMFGSGYEEFYRQAQEKYNIRFIRGRISEASENVNKQIVIKAEDTLIGRPLKMTLDKLVLMVGMERSEGTEEMIQLCNLTRNTNGFISTIDPHLGLNHTDQNGLFATGSCTGPMNLTDTVTNARFAAIEIYNYLNQ